MRIVLLLYILLFTGISALSQGSQYHINYQGDTIYGRINSNLARDNSLKIPFEPNEQEEVTYLTPNNTSHVFFDENTRFEPVVFNNNRYFMAVEFSGRLSVYNFTRYEVNSAGVVTTKILDKKGTESVEISTFNFRRQLSDLLFDCREVLSDVLKRKYRYRDLVIIAQEYETCELNYQIRDIPNLSKIKRDFNSVYTEIEKSSFQDKAAVLEIMSDIGDRLDEGTVIPQYSWEALFSKIRSQPEWERKLQEIRKKLTE